MERSLVQILVTVAITQTKILRIEVEKGFRWTSIEPELVEPNMSINFAKIEQMDGLSFPRRVASFTAVSRLWWQCVAINIWFILHGKGRSLKDTSRVEYNDRGDSQRPCEGLLRRSKSYLFLIIGSGRQVSCQREACRPLLWPRKEVNSRGGYLPWISNPLYVVRSNDLSRLLEKHGRKGKVALAGGLHYHWNASYL